MKQNVSIGMTLFLLSMGGVGSANPEESALCENGGDFDLQRRGQPDAK
jgi:hypothetical protein